MWWLGAILSPIGFTVLGLLTAPSSSRSENDWFGLGGICSMITIGCVASVVCKEVSQRKREKLRFLAGLGAWPSIAWLGLILVSLLGRVIYWS